MKNILLQITVFSIRLIILHQFNVLVISGEILLCCLVNLSSYNLTTLVVVWRQVAALTTEGAGVGAEVRFDVAAADGRSELHDEGHTAEQEGTHPRIHFVPHPPPPTPTLRCSN